MLRWPDAFVAVAIVAGFTLLMFTGHCHAPVGDSVECVRAGGKWVVEPGTRPDHCQQR